MSENKKVEHKYNKGCGNITSMKGGTDNSRRVPAEEAATLDEITEAIESLSESDLRKLKSFAVVRMRGLSNRALRRNWSDLLGEAIESIYVDRRRWNKDNVDFVKFLSEAMRSISNKWYKQLKADETFVQSELISIDKDGKETDVMSTFSKDDWDTQQELETKKEVEVIENLVEKRELAALIVEAWKEGMKRAEVINELGLSEKNYDSEARWIRRNVKSILGDKNGRRK